MDKKVEKYPQTPQRLAFIALVVTILGCKEPTPPPSAPLPPPAAPSMPAPAPPCVHVMPFPARFTLARWDLPDFTGTVDVGYVKTVGRQKFGLAPVLSERFGCYALAAKCKWIGSPAELCGAGGVFSVSRTGFRQGGFLFHALHDQGEYSLEIISVWKVRGDSVDFYAILDQGFMSEGWKSQLQIDSIRPMSAKRRRLFGRFSWEGEDSRRIVRPWSAVWTLPDQLEVR